MRNYVEPFAGSLAVLLGRPWAPAIETVNDVDAYLANFWRAVAADPEEVARHADWPVNEADLHARHRWLVETGRERVERCSDPEYFDAKVAGWWVWGQCLWIGSGWCSRPEWSGRANAGATSRGIQRPHLGSDGQGQGLIRKLPAIAGRDGGRGAYAKSRSTPAKLPLLGGATITRKRPALTGNGGGNGVNAPGLGAAGWAKRPVLQHGEGGRGVLRLSHGQIPDLSGDSGAAGRGIHAVGFHARTGGLYAYMQALSDRLRRVRVCVGDFERLLGPAVTTCIGTTGVFLDPPYPLDGRAVCYSHDSAGEGDMPVIAISAAHVQEVDGRSVVDLTALPLERRPVEVLRLVRILHHLGRGGVWWRAYRWAIDNGDNPELRIALCGYEHPDAVFPPDWEEVAWKASGGYGRSARGQANARRERIWFSPGCLRGEQGQLW